MGTLIDLYKENIPLLSDIAKSLVLKDKRFAHHVEEVEEMFSTRSLGLKGASKRSREKARAKEKEQKKSKKKEEVEESIIMGLNKSSAEYKAGKAAAKKGIKYDANPHAPGVKRLNWSTGHNDFRADNLRKAGKPNYGARGQFEGLEEGTWHIAKDMTKLKNTMKQPMPLGTGSFDFVAKYIGDDELWDDFQDLKTGQDMRPAIKKAMKRLGIKEEVQLDEFTISDIQQMVKKGWVNKISPEKMKELQKINQKNNGNITRQDLLNLNIAHLGIAKEADLTKTQIKMVHDKADELPKHDFIKRYGKDGDSVRYATATNIVKKKLGIED